MSQMKIASVELVEELYTEFILPYFPKDEVKPLKSILRMVKTGLYKIIYIEENDVVTGVAFLTTYPGGEVYLLDYLAVKEEYRSGGFGGKLLQACQEATDGKPVLIETEKVELAPDEETRRQREKRNLFYERNQAVKSGVVSKMFGVTYDNWCLDVKQRLSAEQVREEIANIYRFMVDNDVVYDKNIFFLN